LLKGVLKERDEKLVFFYKLLKISNFFLKGKGKTIKTIKTIKQLYLLKGVT
jgi:hypothetical protein